jgi:fermentation-respiration switch protein FrsA (DUF1100 family)
MLFLYIALAAAAFFAAYILAAALYLHRLAACRADKGRDHNYDPSRPDAVPSAGSSSFCLAAREGNVWWNSQKLERLETASHDGLRLVGHLLRAKKPSRRLAVVMHGHQCVSGEMGFAARLFRGMGFHVFMPDQRAHGKSEGRFCGMGVFERLDLLAWLGLLNGLFPDGVEIALLGVSMGAATVMLAASDPGLPANVVCAVADCGFTRFYDTLRFLLKNNYPPLPFKGLFLRAASGITAVRAGYSFSDASCIKAMPDSRIPMLFIHGDADRVVPFGMMRLLCEAHPGPKETLAVKGGEHAAAYFADPGGYSAAVKNWAGRFFSGEISAD